MLRPWWWICFGDLDLLRGFGVDSGAVCLAGWGGWCCLLVGWGGFGGFTCDRFRVCVWLDNLVLIVFVDLVCGLLRVGFGGAWWFSWFSRFWLFVWWVWVVGDC